MNRTTALLFAVILVSTACKQQPTTQPVTQTVAPDPLFLAEGWYRPHGSEQASACRVRIGDSFYAPSEFQIQIVSPLISVDVNDSNLLDEPGEREKKGQYDFWHPKSYRVEVKGIVPLPDSYVAEGNGFRNLGFQPVVHITVPGHDKVVVGTTTFEAVCEGMDWGYDKEQETLAQARREEKKEEARKRQAQEERDKLILSIK